MRTAGTASATPGERATGQLPIGEERCGTALALPVTIINGESPGKTLYIQAASDGNELNGIGVVNEVIPQLDPATITGTVIVVGIVNVYGFRSGDHRNPIDDRKINRTYPGDPEGSSSERIAAVTYELASEADLVLDLHQGSTSRMIDECRVRCGTNHRQHDACLELAKVFGCGYVLDQKGPDGQLARVAPDDGIPAIDPELGGSVGWDNASIATGVDGVFNVLRQYGFLEGEVTQSTQVRAHGFEQYGASSGGFTRLLVPLGERVEQGDALFEITSVFGEQKKVVKARDDGVLWRARRLPQVATGEYVCTVGTRLDEY